MRVELEPGRAEEIEIAPSKSAEIWLPLEDLRAASGVPPAPRFNAAYEDARKARGFSRTVTASIEPGKTAWISGALERDRGDGPLRLAPARGLPPIASTLDPRAVCHGWLLGQR